MKGMKLKIKKRLNVTMRLNLKDVLKFSHQDDFFLFSIQGIQHELRSIYIICNNILLLSNFLSEFTQHRETNFMELPSLFRIKLFITFECTGKAKVDVR